MKNLFRNCINHKQAKKRIIAWVLLSCFIVVSLLSEAFIFTRANHTHDHDGIGGGCAVCTQIQNAEKILKQIGIVALGGFIVWTGLYAAAVIVEIIFSNVAILTPVTSKVRMNH